MAKNSGAIVAEKNCLKCSLCKRYGFHAVKIVCSVDDRKIMFPYIRYGETRENAKNCPYFKPTTLYDNNTGKKIIYYGEGLEKADPQDIFWK